MSHEEVLEQELEAELRLLRPLPPSPNLQGRLAEQLTSTKPPQAGKRRAHRSPFSLATAALLMLGANLCIYRIATRRPEQSQIASTQPKAGALALANTVSTPLPVSIEDLDAYLDARAARWLALEPLPNRNEPDWEEKL